MGLGGPFLGMPSRQRQLPSSIAVAAPFLWPNTEPENSGKHRNQGKYCYSMTHRFLRGANKVSKCRLASVQKYARYFLV